MTLLKYSQLKKKAIKGEITSPDFRYWFDGSILQKDGVPILLYHQTSKENEKKILEEGYDISKGKARLSDEVMPDGIFLKYDEKDIGLGAIEKEDRTNMAFYVKLVNPLVVDNRNELARFLSQNPEYTKIFEEIKEVDAAEKKQSESYFEQMYSLHRNENSAYKEIHTKINKHIEEWKEKIRALATEARRIGTSFLQEKGYDGIIMENDSGSFGRKIRTVVVFSPEQIKTAQPGKELPKKN